MFFGAWPLLSDGGTEPWWGDPCRMQAGAALLSVWQRFSGVPMETFTKIWWRERCAGVSRQRTVAEMIAHRRELGTGGNCFDLALWLRHDLRQSGIAARIIGHDLCAAHAHVAVVAGDARSGEFLCDLGDQWLQPILISPDRQGFSPEWQSGFFAGREVRIDADGHSLAVVYRHRGRVISQCFDLAAVEDDALDHACSYSQNLVRSPICEMLLPYQAGQVEHWEYDSDQSFWRLASGAVYEEPCATQDEWAERISRRSGIRAELLRTAFRLYGGHE